MRKRDRADGTTARAVLYSANNKQTSTTFDAESDAEEFRQAVNSIGADHVMRAWGITPTKQPAKRATGMTVADWVDKHIASRLGLEKSTQYDYRARPARRSQTSTASYRRR